MSNDAAAFCSGPGWPFFLASNSVLVLRVDADETILAANAFATHLIGEALVGQTLASILIDFGHRTSLSDWIGHGPQRRLLNVRTASGLPHTLEATLEPMGVDYLLFGEVNAADQALLSREVLEVNHELNNVSRELALKNDDLIKTQCQLLESEKMAAVGQLAAGLAHEINNAVGFVKSNTGASQRYFSDINRVVQTYEALDHELSENGRSRVARVKQHVGLEDLQQDLDSLFAETFEGIQRIQDLVRDLRTFSNLDGACHTWANPEQGIDSALNMILGDRLNRVKVSKDYAGIPEIRCAPSQLNQVFMSILLNALEAIDPPGVIMVRTGFSAREVWIEIEDSGKGISPEHLQRIFEPFFTTKPVGQGMGLGLALAYGIVKRHRGRIDVMSEPGQGTRVKIVLPIDNQ